MANVLTPSGDLSAGIKRRQLFHFVGIDVEIERSKTYYFSLVLPLRDLGVPEATCIVVDVLKDVAVLTCRISRTDDYCIATFDIEIEARLCHR
jgi:hypothetical protein